MRAARTVPVVLAVSIPALLGFATPRPALAVGEPEVLFGRLRCGPVPGYAGGRPVAVQLVLGVFGARVRMERPVHDPTGRPTGVTTVVLGEFAPDGTLQMQGEAQGEGWALEDRYEGRPRPHRRLIVTGSQAWRRTDNGTAPAVRTCRAEFRP
jgi:hypothetical protein